MCPRTRHQIAIAPLCSQHRCLTAGPAQQSVRGAGPQCGTAMPRRSAGNRQRRWELTRNRRRRSSMSATGKSGPGNARGAHMAQQTSAGMVSALPSSRTQSAASAADRTAARSEAEVPASACKLPSSSDHSACSSCSESRPAHSRRLASVPARSASQPSWR